MRTTIWLGLVIAGVGCGGGGGGPDTPPEKCDAFVDTVCDRLVDCLDGADGMHRECVEAFNDALTCATVKNVAPTFDACLDDLAARSCALLAPTDQNTGEQDLVLPATCEDVLLLSSAPPRDRASTMRAITARLRR